jgi:hypothetical protein
MLASADRPPYVQFEVQSVEDRGASLQQGHYITKDVVFAIVTPAGSKDRIPRQADDWFAQLEQQVQEGRFPREWLNHYKAAYDAFKSDREPPLHGTSIRYLTVLSPAQVQLCLNFSVRTIEDLAAANEETLGRLGMGARMLKQKAIEWLESSKTVGQQVEKITALQQRNTDLEELVKIQGDKIAALTAQVEALTSKT